MKVLKFGGSSMLEGFEQVKKISAETAEQDESTVVVVSAFKDVTNTLLHLADVTEQGDAAATQEAFVDIKRLHIDLLNRYIAEQDREKVWTGISGLFDELSRKINACLELRSVSVLVKDLIASFGERLSAMMLSASLQSDGKDAEYIDARELVKTTADFTEAKVDFAQTNRLIQERLGSTRKKISVVTGFIGSAPDGSTTTLGRGGSDYTAAIFASALDAEAIHLYKEVDGVLSADPRLVTGVDTVNHLSYDEMRALAVAGAKVVHPPAVLPAERKHIPIRVLNTFDPEHPGTLIDHEKNGESREVKVVSSINDVTIITLTGSAIHEGAGVDHRVTASTTRAKANVLMKSQANEDSICLVVSKGQAQSAMDELKRTFAEELDKGAVNIKDEPDHSILSVVGEGMRNRAGVAGRLFKTIAAIGVSAHAFAQDAKELCIAVAIPKGDLKNTLQAVHDEFVLKQKVVNLFVIGPGRVGKEMLQRLHGLRENHLEHHGVEFRLAGVINNSRMLLSANGGIPFETWEEDLSAGEEADLQSFVDRVRVKKGPHTIVVDASASVEPVRHYPPLLEKSIAVVTPNKNALASDAGTVREIREAAKKGNTVIGYETNVGAGMGAISKIRDAVEGGDEIMSIEGVLSGTLGYIFSSYDGSKSFTEVVREAYEKNYTEPNPADDLSLADVRKKILILAREAGAVLEEADVQIIPLLSNACANAKNAEEFFRELVAMDESFSARYQKAAQEGKRLRVIARYENGVASIGLQEVDPSHPAFALQGTKNLVSCTTRDRPDGWAVMGAGAGIGVTASGVIADLLKAAKHS